MNQNNSYKIVLLLILNVFVPGKNYGQEVPSSLENIPYLVTFGINSDHSGGDDDFSQTVFFLIPKSRTDSVYLRIFDPEVAGELDELNGGWDTKIKYSIYGGKDAYSDKDARGVNPTGNYKSGILIDSRMFGSETSTDKKWVSMVPVNPTQGEFVPELDGYVIKVVIDGLKGNDANIYKLFLSTRNGENIAVEGATAFAYEYSVRLQMTTGAVSHIYPFADNLITSINVRCFDFDEDAQVKLYSSVKNGHLVKTSNNNEWSSSSHKIKDEEKGKCFDLQIVKKQDLRNDVVIYITNEYDSPVPFYTAPSGGLPKYKYKISVQNSVKPQ